MWALLSLNLPIESFFTYSVPAEMAPLIQVGQRVEVLFRGKSRLALVISINSEEPGFKTLPIKRLLDTAPLTPGYALEIAAWMADYYACSINEALHLFVPPGIKPSPYEYQLNDQPPFYPLNKEQKVIYQSIRKNLNTFYPALIYGVTGSGKTEVYRHLVKDVVEAGKQAVILVPEISLTPQTISRFASLFGLDAISIINSRMTPSNKLYSFHRIKKGETPIILGPRSALFTPTEQLGLIIIDEEQEHSYKSGESPRYHARQVAFKIARQKGIPLVLGSATPALETFYAAKSGKIAYFELKERYKGMQLPSVKLIDMKNEPGDFSRELITKVYEQQKSGYQSILFINRRGYSPHIICKHCGYRFLCPDCSVTLTYHREDHTFECHYCGYSIPHPGQCSKCGQAELDLVGVGTERLELELSELFRSFKIVRMDRDVTQKKGSHAAILEQVRSGEADILVGTQMIAKGLDFDKVRLVGVVSADISLNLPDFRSGEYTYSLLTQVAGRAGRKVPGEVLIQTYHPEHYILERVREQNYALFFEKELEARRRFDYPPFTRIVRLVIRGEEEEKIKDTADTLYRDLKNAGYAFLGPVPCPLEKIKKNYRYHLFLKALQVAPVVKTLKKLLSEKYQKIKDIYVEVDVDPVSML